MKELTTDKALLFSATLLVAYTIVCMIFQWFEKPIDSTLTASVFIAFGVAEGGYCTYIHRLKKQREDKKNEAID